MPNISGEPVQAAPGVQLVARSCISVKERALPYSLNSSRKAPDCKGKVSPRPIRIPKVFELLVMVTGLKAVTLAANTPSMYPFKTSVVLLYTIVTVLGTDVVLTPPGISKLTKVGPRSLIIFEPLLGFMKPFILIAPDDVGILNIPDIPVVGRLAFLNDIAHEPV